MTKHGDFVPSKEADLIDWLDNFVSKVQANAAKWQIPQDEVAELVALVADFKAKHAKCAGPDRSKTMVEEKNEAKAAVIAKVRSMVKFRFANPAITDTERVSAGLHAQDKIRTPIGVPDSRCLITDLKPLGGFRVEIHFRDEAAPHTRAIPYGCNGSLLSYGVGPEKIGDYTQLGTSKLMTATPFVLQLTPEAEGAFLSVCCRWQNNKGDLGPMSEILHIAVS